MSFCSIAKKPRIQEYISHNTYKHNDDLSTKGLKNRLASLKSHLNAVADHEKAN